MVFFTRKGKEKPLKFTRRNGIPDSTGGVVGLPSGGFVRRVGNSHQREPRCSGGDTAASRKINRSEFFFFRHYLWVHQCGEAAGARQAAGSSQGYRRDNEIAHPPHAYSSANEPSSEASVRERKARHKEDRDIQAKELALPPGSKAYYGVVRAGLCNAYLAASVVDSSLVRTSKTGGMGKAGETLKVLSSAVPVVGGLAGFAAAALKAGDHHIQTRRVVKITEMATDVTECCSLARTLALRLADGHAAGTIPTARLPTMGRCGRNQGSGGGALPDGADEEAVMEWFTDEVANADASNSSASNGSSEEKAGRQLGKRHLQKLLTAMGRGCLQGTNTAKEKVERLLKVVIPQASGMTASTIPRAPEQPFVRSPVSTTPVDASFDREAEFAAMKARMEALEADNKRLVGEVETVKKRIPEPKQGPNGGVDAGGGQIFAQKQETKTTEDFWQEDENTVAVAAADHVVTPAQFREFVALQDERHREQEDRHRDHEANHAQLQRALDRKKKKRGGRG